MDGLAGKIGRRGADSARWGQREIRLLVIVSHPFGGFAVSAAAGEGGGCLRSNSHTRLAWKMCAQIEHPLLSAVGRCFFSSTTTSSSLQPQPFPVQALDKRAKGFWQPDAFALCRCEGNKGAMCLINVKGTQTFCAVFTVEIA